MNGTEAWQRTETQSVIPMQSCWLETMCTWRSFWDQTQLVRLLPDDPGTKRQSWRMHCWASHLYCLQATKAICRPKAPNHWTHGHACKRVQVKRHRLGKLKRCPGKAILFTEAPPTLLPNIVLRLDAMCAFGQAALQLHQGLELQRWQTHPSQVHPAFRLSMVLAWKFATIPAQQVYDNGRYICAQILFHESCLTTAVVANTATSKATL